MPIYEYHCAGCGNDFEELVLSSSSSVRCPACQSSNVAKLMSAFAFKANKKFVSSSHTSSCSSCSSHSCSTCGSS